MKQYLVYSFLALLAFGQLTFSRLHDKVHIFYSILLKLAQIVCIVRINPMENEENLPNIMGKGAISNFG